MRFIQVFWVKFPSLKLSTKVAKTFQYKQVYLFQRSGQTTAFPLSVSTAASPNLISRHAKAKTVSFISLPEDWIRRILGILRNQRIHLTRIEMQSGYIAKNMDIP